MIDLDEMRKKKYIIRLQGKEYTTHAGLLATAHENGLEGVWVEMVSWDPEARAAVMKATAKGQRGTYTDYGDASPSNVGKMIANACIRMAATRASSRALRLYLGVGMTCFEELPGKDPEPHKPVDHKQVAAGWKRVRENSRESLFYNHCVNKGIEPELADYIVCKVKNIESIKALDPTAIDGAIKWLVDLPADKMRAYKAEFLGEVK
tara:strand:- start:952 stop:1572 length:621 start_codon:yes stop_codon:yes gene_type:complete